jgi:hypothetical protein
MHEIYDMTLNAEQMLADAEKTTGLSDWGGDTYFEDSFRKLYGAMANSLANNEGQLHEQGLRGAEMRLRVMAEERLKFINDRKKWPAITEENIVKPIFILGLPRAGSTFLHSLMEQDPGNRNPQTWEMMFSSPPPEQSSYGNDPRIERCQSLMRAMGMESPEAMSLHPYGARQPEECHFLMEHMGFGDNLPGIWRMPSFNKVRASLDLRQGYQIHRMGLQNLQHRYRGERWVLKNPGHVFYLDHLLAVYPDAHIIQTHRDPAKVMPSITALLMAIRKANSDRAIDGVRIAKGNLLAFAAGLDQAIEFRRQPGMEEHFHDVHFRNLIADPMATVRAIYQRFGLTLSDEAIARMEAWLASDDSHSVKAKFTLAQFELDEARIDQAFGNYMAHYGIAPERASR